MPRGKKRESSGKVVDTWYYEYTGIIEGADAETAPSQIKVPVYLVIFKKFDESSEPPMGVNEVWFEVQCPKFGFQIHGTDIEVLRTAMWNKLDKQFEIKWEQYYLVQITRQSPYFGLGTGLAFTYQSVAKGTAWDGSFLLRKQEYGHRHVERWPGAFADRHGNVVACIPDTEENTEALRRFSEKIDELRNLLADYLRPEKIMETLLNLAGVFQLPPPVDAQAGESQDENLDTGPKIQF
jgi:hypothetical protein